MPTELKIRQNNERQATARAVIERVQALGFELAVRTDLGAAVWSLNDEMLVEVVVAPLSSRRREYQFALDFGRFEQLYSQNRHFFLLLVCESDRRVFVLPLSLVMEIFHDHIAANHSLKNFTPALRLRNGVWLLRFLGHYDITDYLNRYDFLISESKTYRAEPTRFSTTIEIKTLEERLQLLAEAADIRRDSVHSATVDMLRRIGEWSGFEVITEGGLRGVAGFPYQIDVLWYKGGDLYLAIEVCHHGVVEKDKDALKLARQQGARKVVIVSEVNKLERIRKLFQFEGEIKSWAEIWSFERVFGMFESGLRFFKDFDKFRRYGWQEGLTEFI